MKALYEELGGVIELGQWEPRGWIIERVHVRPMVRQRGIASRLLRQACADADREGVVLVLVVQPEGGRRSLTYGELVRWYARHGFVLMSGSEVMQRIPRRTK